MKLRTKKQREAAFMFSLAAFSALAAYVVISWSFSLILGFWGWLVLPGLFGGIALLTWGVMSWIDAGEAEGGETP